MSGEHEQREKDDQRGWYFFHGDEDNDWSRNPISPDALHKKIGETNYGAQKSAAANLSGSQLRSLLNRYGYARCCFNAGSSSSSPSMAIDSPSLKPIFIVASSCARSSYEITNSTRV